MIESASNPLFKRIKALQTKKARERESVFVIEGKSFVDDMPEDARVKRYVVSDSFARTHDVSMYEKRAETTIISDGLFKKAADSVTPQGILAICEQPDATLDEAVKRDRLSLLCECVSDPGNLGALIRVAAAVGCGVAILAGECADLYNPKTVRAAAGAILRIPTIRVADVEEAARFLKERGIKLVAASVDANVCYTDADLTGGRCVLIGSEATGLSERALSLVDIAIKIPMERGVESLNAAVAGGVTLYEAWRQRRVIA